MICLKLSEMISRYNLHDSLVEDIKFFQDEEKLLLDIKLCNWRQPLYQDGEPEVLKLQFIFTRVTKFEIESETMSIESDEILEITPIKSDIGEAIKIVLHGNEDIKIINVIANEVLAVIR